ncbi:hypothetical protein scyTo_0000718 [Scyliorhinus torazame]|uniref:Uncharacterized protein n=1 Tax=Scyliorhinus torazame TaxID=75743 RepID=A0A401P2M6_SCYTO|nr:hypothetical protein [Scyliorhinus torazame]
MEKMASREAVKMLTPKFLILLFYVMGSIWANEDESTPSIQGEPMEKRFAEGMIASDFSEVAMALLRKKFVDMLISANG